MTLAAVAIPTVASTAGVAAVGSCLMFDQSVGTGGVDQVWGGQPTAPESYLLEGCSIRVRRTSPDPSAPGWRRPRFVTGVTDIGGTPVTPWRAQFVRGWSAYACSALSAL
ncbi:hypothetical protein GCM10009646_14300 [Streptomyces aureus]